MSYSLKDTFYSRPSLEAMAAVFAGLYPDFDASAFLAMVHDAAWPERSLMQRARHIAASLHTVLPSSYPAAVELLCRAAAKLQRYPFHTVALAEYVALYGLADWDVSLPALAELTKFGTAEFAVRPFLLHDMPRMLTRLAAWAQDSNEHIRRLSSEGSRPRLPWGTVISALVADPTPIIPILERLKDDSSEYVRRSVSNALNDIGKDNPAVLIDLMRRWSTDASANRRWIIERALRTLVKAGDSQALALLGYDQAAQVDVRSLALSAPVVSLNAPITISAEIVLRHSAPQPVAIDYVVYFMKANGRQAPKVFKLTKKLLQPGEALRISKTLRFQPLTTRVLYAGQHAIALKINGIETKPVVFELCLK